MAEAKNLLHEKLTEFTRSFKFDRRLFAHDVRVSIAYCDALFHAGIVTRIEAERIRNGLQTILKRADFYTDYFEEPLANDVHSFVEMRLAQLIGDAGAAKLNVGRSRHDQSVTAFRLWLREEIEKTSTFVRDLQTILIEAGERQREAIFPAYVNSRRTQPVLWAHWCLAYFEMFSRDRERLDEVWRRVNVLPLGAGTAAEIDREEIARALGFEGISANSLDTASDADFAVESIGTCALTAIHLARLAEDLIINSSDEFGFIEFDDALLEVVSGHLNANKSIEALELVRGKAGAIIGHQTALLSTVKNLPLGVHKDLQENKTAVFETIDATQACLQIVSIILKNIRVNETKTLAAASSDYFNAAEFIDYLVQRNVSLKTAENSVGEIVSYAAAHEKNLDDLSLDEFRRFSEVIGADIFQHLSLEQSLAGKNQIGGTAPERVFEALENAREILNRETGK